jgi:hypothetical protein
MTAEQQAQLQRLVGPLAWTYYGTLPALDVANLLTDMGGSVQLVAAEVLAYACLSARRSLTLTPAVDVKIGGIAIKRTVGTSSLSTDADAWCQQASQLRAEVRAIRRGAPSFASVTIRSS